MVPDGEIVLESTPNGASGLFYEEWDNGEKQDTRGISFPGGMKVLHKRM